LTIALIPLTFSIANGIAFGLIAYVAIETLRRHAVNWFLYPLTALCILRFLYLGRG
jgi:AGZA family xanthine/uracil permease-like MFS transporter